VNCGKELWENCLHLTLADGSITVEQHLQNIGISTYDKFIEHLAEVERKFWYERFAEYKAWKDNIQLVFQKQGFIESFLGFRYTGYLSYNEVSNYAIQGTAFHCLLWTLIELVKLSKIEKWKSKVMGQIHDSIVMDLYPPEQEHVIKSLMEIGTKKIREKFDWIIVPLDMEIELTGIDEPWCEKKEIQL
jgi:DNA polymerase I-like protein with 3'-5' exonuclease and polymerase domains